MEWILKNKNNLDSEKSKIFLNEPIFSLDYTPINIIEREDKIKELFNYFSSMFYESENFEAIFPSILVLGGSGTGKSFIIQKFGSELQNLLEQKKPNKIFEFRYVNCRRNRSVFTVLVTLMKSFLPDFPNRGFSSSEILRMFQDMLQQTQTHVLLALDEINFLTQDPDFQNFLYSLSRINEEYLNMYEYKISIIFIAQNEIFLDFVDNAVKSSLYKNIIFFEKYSKDQLFKILKERSKLGFLPNTISDNLLLKIAEFTQSNGDARFSIEFLWRIAKKFEYSKTNESLEESFSNILTEIIPFSKEILNDLSLPQTIFLLSIIQCLERNPEQIFVTLSQVKSEFQIKCQELKLKIGSGNTSLWNHLQVLKKLEIIEIDVVSKNYRGRFSKIYLKAPKQIIKSELLSKIEKEL